MPSASIPPAVEALAADDAQDPEPWLRAVCWVTIAFAALQVLLFSFGRDQGIYAMVASGLLDGKLPYRDIWDFKPPGIYLLYAVAFGALGESMLAPRILEVVGFVGIALAFQRLGKVYFGSRTAGLLAAAVACLVYAQMEFWHSGQPESFGAFFIVGALVLTARNPAGRRQRYLNWAGIGILFGCAFLLKPPLGGGALVCAAYLGRQVALEHERPAIAIVPFLVVGLSSLLPIAACALWFWAAGGWSALYWTLGEFTPGYTALGWNGASAPELFYYAVEECFFRFSALIGLGFLAAIIMRPLHSREREAIFLVSGIASIQLAGIALQGKFFPYHYAATLPLLALIAGLGWYKLWRRSATQGPTGAVLFAMVIAIVTVMHDPVRDVPHGFWKRSQMRTEYLFGLGPFHSRSELDRELYRVADYSLGADRRVADEIAGRTNREDAIYVWGFEPAIYWLSRRPASTRFIYNVPQRSEWQRDFSRRELERDLKQNPPEIVVVQHHDVFPVVTGNALDSHRALADFPELRTLIDTRYQLVKRIEDFDVFAVAPHTTAR